MTCASAVLLHDGAERCRLQALVSQPTVSALVREENTLRLEHPAGNTRPVSGQEPSIVSLSTTDVQADKAADIGEQRKERRGLR
jgi:hypothetical protein